jgi:predicted MPP superfamily phosphohydrolase
MEENIEKFLKKKKGYLKKSNIIILERLGYSPTKNNLSICANIKARMRLNLSKENKKVEIDYKSIYVDSPKSKNILVIGDLHEPFCLKEYLPFCKKIYVEENCDTVLFIGDVIDNHYSSYHETDPDGYSAGEELDRAIDKIKTWNKAFPKAYVIIGNHDRLVYRKAHTSSLSKRWIREFHEVLETPDWEFLEMITIDGICFNHGEGMTARNRMKNEMQSQVQGHYHRKAYGMAYAKHFKKPIIGCATIKNGIPQLHPMEL